MVQITGVIQARTLTLIGFLGSVEKGAKVQRRKGAKVQKSSKETAFDQGTYVPSRYLAYLTVGNAGMRQRQRQRHPPFPMLALRHSIPFRPARGKRGKRCKSCKPQALRFLPYLRPLFLTSVGPPPGLH